MWEKSVEYYQCNNLSLSYKGKQSTDKLFVQILLWVAQQILEMAHVSLFQQKRCYSQFHIKTWSVCMFVRIIGRIKGLGDQSAYCSIKLKQHTVMHKDSFQEKAIIIDANLIKAISIHGACL